MMVVSELLSLFLRLGIGSQIVFESWRDHVRKRLLEVKQTNQREEKLKQLELESRRAANELGRFEAKKWIQKIVSKHGVESIDDHPQQATLGVHRGDHLDLWRFKARPHRQSIKLSTHIRGAASMGSGLYKSPP